MRLRRLLLLRIDDHIVDQHSRHPDVMGFQRAFLGDPLDLGDNDAAVVACGQRLIEAAEIGAFMFVCQVAALVGGGGADDCDLRDDRGKEQPVVALEAHALDHRMFRRQAVHRATLPLGIDECIDADLGQDARPLRGGFAMDVEEDT